MTDLKITKLKRQRTVSIEQLTRTQDFFQTKAANATYAELDLRIHFLDKAYDSLVTTQSQLEMIDDDECATKNRAEFEELYFILKPSLEILRDTAHSKLRTTGTTIQQVAQQPRNPVELPKISITPFSGDYTKWFDFTKSFDSLVHKNNAYDAIAKFQYLRNSVEGAAANTIAALELTETNYEVARELLKNRFENRKIICKHHMQQMFSAKSIDKPTTAKLRLLIDTFNSNLRSLNSLGRPTKQWDDLIVEIMKSKLDVETLHKWDDEAPSNRLETLDELIQFLSKRCETLDCMSQPLKACTSAKASPTVHRQNVNATFSTSNNKPRFQCEFCSKPGHRIFRCRKFLSTKRPDRLRDVKRLNLCTNCLSSAHQDTTCESSYHCNIPNCTERHNSLIHQFEGNERTNELSASTSNTRAPFGNRHGSTSNHPTVASCLEETPHADTLQIASNTVNSYVFLATALITAIDVNGATILCRALLDSGSQINLITEALDLQLGFQRRQQQTQLGGIGNTTLKSKSKIHLKLKSRINDFSANIEACVLPKITNNQPHSSVNIKRFSIPKNITLADPQFHKPQKIDILIGADLYYRLLSVGQISISNTMPLLQNTLLGWIVVGNSISDPDIILLPDPTLNQVNHLADNHDDLNLNHQLEKFFQIEDIEESVHRYSVEEALVEEHFKKHVYRDQKGKFVVSLPFSKHPSVLGDSLQMATHRFYGIERTLEKNSTRKLEYARFLEEYLKLGHMELISPDLIPQCHYFLPHHCIIKEHSSSTKLRVVFDASAKTLSGISLNDILMVGPVVQQDLFAILLRFRTHQFVLSADIKQMYRQIMVHPPDTNLQCILWREHKDTDIKIYRLRTVTYGTACAPYLATKCLQKLSQDEENNNKRAAKVIRNDMYVDDLLIQAQIPYPNFRKSNQE